MRDALDAPVRVESGVDRVEENGQREHGEEEAEVEEGERLAEAAALSRSARSLATNTHDAAAKGDPRAGVWVERTVLAQPARGLEGGVVGAETTARAGLARRLGAQGIEQVGVALVTQTGETEQERDGRAGRNAMAKEGGLYGRLACADVGDAGDAQRLVDDGFEVGQLAVLRKSASEQLRVRWTCRSACVG